MKITLRITVSLFMLHTFTVCTLSHIKSLSTNKEKDEDLETETSHLCLLLDAFHEH